MDIEAAKKRSVNGKIDTHHQGILLRGMIENFDPKTGTGYIHCSDSKNRFFSIEDMIEETPIAVGEVIGFIGIRTGMKGSRRYQAIQIGPAQPRKELSFRDNLKLKFGHWDWYVARFLLQLEEKQKEEKSLTKQNIEIKHVDYEDTSSNLYETDSWYNPISHNSFDFNEMDNPSIAFQRDTYENPM